MVLVSINRFCEELIDPIAGRTSSRSVLALGSNRCCRIETQLLLGTNTTNDLKDTVLFDFLLCFSDVFLANTVISFALSKLASNPHEIYRFSGVTMRLGCEGRCKWKNIGVDDIVMEGILSSAKNCLKLIRIVVIKVNIFWSERTECSTPDRLHHLRVI